MVVGAAGDISGSGGDSNDLQDAAPGSGDEIEFGFGADRETDTEDDEDEDEDEDGHNDDGH